MGNSLTSKTVIQGTRVIKWQITFESHLGLSHKPPQLPLSRTHQAQHR